MMKQPSTPRSAEAFYHSLQNSRFRPDAFESWEEYRCSVTSLLIDNCEEGSSLAIFGAGHCNDIDLGKLCGHFSQITLLDYNKASLERALEQYHVSDHPAIQLHEIDFVGIRDADYIQYLSALQGEDPAAALKCLDQMYEKASHHTPAPPVAMHDYSLTLNVHSQLNDTADWLRTEMTGQLGTHLDPDGILGRRIAAETEGLIVRFNDLIFASTRKTAFIGYETGLESRGSGGVHGAIQTFLDLRRRQQAGQFTPGDRTKLIWPYDRSRNIVFHIVIEALAISQ